MLEQLKKISGYLEPKPTPPPPKGLAAEFLDFLSKYKIMGLAVAFIIGIYLGAVVQALVNDLIMPVVSYATGAGGGNSWQTLQVGPFLLGISSEQC
ncbi:MAG TPA: MscL family protein [Nitrososphaerales archaeon]|nr:MscL family protein [Nitrososphaerales archaeon]